MPTGLRQKGSPGICSFAVGYSGIAGSKQGFFPIDFWPQNMGYIIDNAFLKWDSIKSERKYISMPIKPG
jgi:hypothetical protein